MQIGEANRLHEGYSSYYRRNEAVPLSSATPFSSTEVTSLRKIATFIFKYRPLDVLQYHSIVPASEPTSIGAIVQHSGDKRPAPDDEYDEDLYAESDEDRQIGVDGGRLTTPLVFPSSDSDSSQVCALWRPRSFILIYFLSRTLPIVFGQRDNIGIPMPARRRCTGLLPQRELGSEFCPLIKIWAFSPDLYHMRHNLFAL